MLSWAASDSRRVMVKPMLLISAKTAARAPERNPSSMAHRTSLSCRARTISSVAGSPPRSRHPQPCRRPDRLASLSQTRMVSRPARCDSRCRRATRKAAADGPSVPVAPDASCRAPSVSPLGGRASSSVLIPGSQAESGSTDVCFFGGPSSAVIRWRKVASATKRELLSTTCPPVSFIRD